MDTRKDPVSICRSEDDLLFFNAVSRMWKES